MIDQLHPLDVKRNQRKRGCKVNITMCHRWSIEEEQEEDDDRPNREEICLPGRSLFGLRLRLVAVRHRAG